MDNKRRRQQQRQPTCRVHRSRDRHQQTILHQFMPDHPHAYMYIRYMQPLLPPNSHFLYLDTALVQFQPKSITVHKLAADIRNQPPLYRRRGATTTTATAAVTAAILEAELGGVGSGAVSPASVGASVATSSAIVGSDVTGASVVGSGVPGTPVGSSRPRSGLGSTVTDAVGTPVGSTAAAVGAAAGGATGAVSPSEVGASAVGAGALGSTQRTEAPSPQTRSPQQLWGRAVFVAPQSWALSPTPAQAGVGGTKTVGSAVGTSPTGEHVLSASQMSCAIDKSIKHDGCSCQSNHTRRKEINGTSEKLQELQNSSSKYIIEQYVIRQDQNITSSVETHSLAALVGSVGLVHATLERLFTLRSACCDETRINALNELAFKAGTAFERTLGIRSATPGVAIEKLVEAVNSDMGEKQGHSKFKC